MTTRMPDTTMMRPATCKPASAQLTLEIFEDGVPPRFRLTSAGKSLRADDVTIETCVATARARSSP